ncbi:hypothetical protein DXG01_005877, partial [Tephrocybe rancida]
HALPPNAHPHMPPGQYTPIARLPCAAGVHPMPAHNPERHHIATSAPPNPTQRWHAPPPTTHTSPPT